MPDKPQGIQRKRTKGWRMPPNTLSVTRPGKYGNPFRVGKPGPLGRTPNDSAGAVGFFAAMLADEELREAAGYPSVDEIRRELRGKNLACFCPIGSPCHRDVLLELANKPEPQSCPTP